MIDCDICHGSNRVRYPKSMRLRADGFRENDALPVDILDSEAVQVTYHEFPCPLCVEQIPYSRLRVLKEVSRMIPLEKDGQFADILTRQAAHMLAERILQEGLMTVERAPSDLGVMYCVTLGIASPNHVATLEDRVAARQFEVAEELVSATSAEINNWGSHYHRSSVDKWQALEWLQSALKRVKEKYSAKRR